MTIAYTQPIDAGRKIAIGYWRRTVHVFSVGYPDRSQCALCDLPQSSIHKPATERPHPTIAMVVPPDTAQRIRLHAHVLHPSCGHSTKNWSYDSRIRPPQVGDAFSCWDCDAEWTELNHPGLPPEIVQAIEAERPACSQCGEVVAHIPYIKRCSYAVYFEVDGQTGSLDGSADHDDTLETEPDWDSPVIPTDGGWNRGLITVSCSNQHTWQTARLNYKQDDSQHLWRVESRS